ncbi:hypothetical protein MMC30_006534 [Trapelia coarctata]|nr:hypothetical protein [Trapelia coarctata]
MPPLLQRQWQARSQQKALLEFAALKYACPEGIHLSLKPNDPSVWIGVFFVRKGPYQSAVLRFRVVLSPSYPHQPPSIGFTSDVFHPLVTPLTTYAGSAGSSTLSLSEEGRLPPGGFNLRHGFPNWFEKQDRNVTRQISMAGPGAVVERLDDSECDSDEHPAFPIPQTPRNGRRRSKDVLEADTPVSSSMIMADGVIDVLYYMRRSFEDEALLDNLPLEAASNTGAWSAWVAHRRVTGQEPASALQAGQVGSQSQNGESVSRRSQPSSKWNWEGVWSKRVVAIVEASASDPVLFTSSENDEPVSTEIKKLFHSLIIMLQIHFLDLDEETLQSIKSKLSEG